MNILIKQKGVGLVEVLVALLLLAIGVIGYAALQLRAVEASSEAMTRSQALLVMRSLTESIRANVAGQALYPAAVNSYVNYTNATSAPTSCANSLCTATQFVNYEAYQAAKSAYVVGMTMTMTDCPGVNSASVRRQCIFGAWGDTTITATDYTNCMSTAGVYKSQAKCIMMEAY